MIFDPSKYTGEKQGKINLAATKRNFFQFVQIYQLARERVGHSMVPKVTQSFSILPPSPNSSRTGDAERILISRESTLEVFEELHGLFLDGYLSIIHENHEKSVRRRSIFFLRYFNGLTCNEITERLFIGKIVVVEESKSALIQFCNRLELTIYDNEIFGD